MKKSNTLPQKVVVFALCLLLLFATAKMAVRMAYPGKYSDHVEHYSSLYGVPAAMVYAVIQTESSFLADAVSSAGAVGLMQIMPSTFLWLTDLLGEVHTVEALYDPEVNIRYGVFYLKYLYEHYNDYRLALAAYNAGPGNVEKWLSSDEYAKNGALVFIPFPETRNYVEKVLRRTRIYEKIYNL